MTADSMLVGTHPPSYISTSRKVVPGLRRVTSKARCDAGISSSTVCQPSVDVLSSTSRYCSLNVTIVRLPLGGATVHRSSTDVSLTGLTSGRDGAATRPATRTHSPTPPLYTYMHSQNDFGFPGKLTIFRRPGQDPHLSTTFAANLQL